MIIAPYKSQYYDINYYYERFGSIVIPRGTEIYLYITDLAVPGVEPYRYSISNRMNVYDYKNRDFVRISDKTNYPSINLFHIDKQKTITSLLHRVYMMTFCYFHGCENYEVNHIDGNKFNCTPINLEWSTHRENMNHAFEYLTNADRKLSDNDIIELIKMYNDNCTIKQIADRFNISAGYVCDIVKGKRSSIRMDVIKASNPITREKVQPKVSEEVLKEIICKYNDGAEYFELAQEYGVDRSGLTKMIKRYAKNHPGKVVLRELKKFTPELAELACKFFEDNIGMDISSLYILYVLMK